MGAGPVTFAFDLTITMSLILAVITMIFTWIRTRRQDFERSIQSVSDKITVATDRQDRMEGRLARAEQTLTGMPARDDIYQLQLSLVEMKGDLRAMQATMSGSNAIMGRLETIVSRHEEHLLDGAK